MKRTPEQRSDLWVFLFFLGLYLLFLAIVMTLLMSTTQ